jgi:hypothetical protein
MTPDTYAHQKQLSDELASIITELDMEQFEKNLLIAGDLIKEPFDIQAGYLAGYYQGLVRYIANGEKLTDYMERVKERAEDKKRSIAGND